MNEYHNDNKVMTLDDARMELEREGMSCDFVTNQRLVGVSSKCRWVLTAKMDTVVIVQKVPGILTREKFLADLKLLPSWVEQHNVGGNDCPPFGFGHGRLVMILYYADTVEPELGYQIRHVARPREWCATTFVAAQDAQGQSFYLTEADRPYWGRIFYPELLHRAKMLTGANQDHVQPQSLPRWFIIMNILIWCLNIYNFIVLPWLFPFFVAILFLHFLVAAIMQWCRKSKFKNEAGDYGRLGENDEDGTDSNKCDILNKV
jgi:hypothetical protein